MTDPAPRSPLSALVASFLLTDLVGYSKGTVKDQYAAKAAFSEILRRHLALLASSDYRVKDTGDGALIVFLASPEHALYMALAITRDFEEVASTAAFPSNQLRTGLNVGMVRQAIDVEAQPNFVGDGINDTKRVMDAAAPGQIVASRAFFEGLACLDAAYAALFSHLGVVRDKHDREHDLYAVAMNAAVLDDLRRDLAAEAPASPTTATGPAAASATTGPAAGHPTSEPAAGAKPAAAPRARVAAVRRPAVVGAVMTVLVIGVVALLWARHTGAPGATSAGAEPGTTAGSSPAAVTPPATAALPSPAKSPTSLATTSPSNVPSTAVERAPPPGSLATMPSTPAAASHFSDTPAKAVDAGSRAERAPHPPAASGAERPRVADVQPATAPPSVERRVASESKVVPPPAPSPIADADKSARCSRIIEKAALGEPLSVQEQRSLETTCR